MSLYSRPSISEWLASRRHLEQTLGRQAYNVGHSDQAAQHFARLLSAGGSNPTDAEAEDDQGFLDNFKLAWDALAEDADSTAETLNIRLSHAIFDKTQTLLTFPEDNESILPDDSSVWLELERDFLDRGFPFQTVQGETRKKPPSLLHEEGNRNAVIGGKRQSVITLIERNL